VEKPLSEMGVKADGTGILRPMLQDPLPGLYDLGEKYTIEDLTNLCHWIECHFLANKFTAIDDMLRDAQLEMLASATIVAILRYTTCAKENLPHHAGCVSRAWHVLNDRGMHADHTLRGLERAP